MNHEEKAQALFLEGCNCAQAVFAAFCDDGLFPARRPCGWPPPWRRCGAEREICGALSGAFWPWAGCTAMKNRGRWRKGGPLCPGPGAGCRLSGNGMGRSNAGSF